MQETDMLKMDSLYKSEQLGQKAKELINAISSSESLSKN
jgi:hypothetical protein